ncbi:putative ubiquitin-conjugating enzyme E2 23-like, partial [Trifolium medium]|nr:putative ubiquitin-conjugating enzyme E2 23-like [Trifolium medium]
MVDRLTGAWNRHGLMIEDELGLSDWKTFVGPQAIYVVDGGFQRDDGDEPVAAGSDISDAASWETVNNDEMEVLEVSNE